MSMFGKRKTNPTVAVSNLTAIPSTEKIEEEFNPQSITHLANKVIKIAEKKRKRPGGEIGTFLRFNEYAELVGIQAEPGTLAMISETRDHYYNDGDQWVQVTTPYDQGGTWTLTTSGGAGGAGSGYTWTNAQGTSATTVTINGTGPYGLTSGHTHSNARVLTADTAINTYTTTRAAIDSQSSRNRETLNALKNMRIRIRNDTT